MIKIEDLVEVKLKEHDDFLKVKETLTRIGVASRREKKTFSILSYTSQARQILHRAF